MGALDTAKQWAMGVAGLGKDALHVYVGLLVLFAAAALLRRGVGSALPLAIVAAVAIAGEIWDATDRIRGGIAITPMGHWHDVWNTIFWPAVLTMLARWTGIFRASGGGRRRRR
ncbi:hypothetical protein [Sphingomonas qomolangmaensis]|uniref:VanZ-like domain-containing protein n=1 Tax=Sphingomonas qomolangmaensis TaxID=2918765 RepID=A0ABY5L7G4_9SPHN|nr:hypothetical protein [Sphingomonas qomolangmaensis]UUL82737.1 hypothetical protein NMP03_00360 [Sphingomonas qomolangmaensis]